MKVKYGNNENDLIERTKELSSISKDGILIAAIVLIAGMVMAFIFFAKNNYNVRLEYKSGNPYNCRNCYELGRACRRHLDFDQSKELDNKISRICEVYIPSDDEMHELYDTYGYGSTYNNECDFCNENKEECYSCKADRIAIFKSILNTDVTSELCGECSKIGYADCDRCREMLAYKVIESFR